MRVRADHVDLVARLHFQFIGLGLNIDGVFRRDELQPQPALAGFHRAAQHADRLPGMNPHLAAGDELGVLPADDGHRFTVRQLQALPGICGETVLRGDSNERIAKVRKSGIGGAEGILARRAGCAGEHGLERRGFVVEEAGIGLAGAEVAGKRHRLVRLCSATERLRQLRCLLQQGERAGHLACRVAGGGAVLDPVTRDEQARAGPDGAVGVGAQFRSQAAEAAAVVVCGMDQVT